MSELDKLVTIDNKYALNDDDVCVKYYRRGINMLANEIRALQALAATAVLPVRKRREVKGVTYQTDAWCLGAEKWTSVSRLIAWCSEGDTTITDEDHAALYALKDDPYEPVDTLVQVVMSILNDAADGETHSVRTYVARIRAAINTMEPPHEEPACINELRLWGGSKLLSSSDFDEGAVLREAVLAAYDAKGVCTITDHVNALLELGARKESVSLGGPPTDVLILPGGSK